MFNPINNFISYSKSLHSNSAIISLKKEVSFIELSKLVKNLSNNFRKFGIKPGQIIVVCFQDKTIEWIVTLALIHEGVVTVSNHGYAELPNELKPDYILVDRPASHLFPFQTILLDEKWFKIGENAFDIEPQDYVSKKNLFRLALTSGTTGYPKVVPLTIEQVENRADLLLSEWKTDGSQHEIINLRLSTAPAFYRLFGTFFLKGLPYYDSSSDIETLKLIANFKVTNIFASPAQLGSLIDEIKKTESDLLSPINIRYAGGNLSLSLSNNIKKYLGLNITNLY
jgi:acyl-coenzyme A synthetase/AMP-(fatty) acid ligase